MLSKYCGYMSVPIYFEDIEGIKRQIEDERSAGRKPRRGKKKAEGEEQTDEADLLEEDFVPPLS